MRQRRQREVAKENEFYLQLMQQALPMELNGSPQQTEAAIGMPQPQTQPAKIHTNRQSHEKNGQIPNGVVANGVGNHATKSHRKSVEKSKEHAEHDHRHSEKHIDRQRVNHSHTNGNAVGSGAEEVATPEPEVRPSRRKEKKEQDKEREAAEYLQKLEMDTKRLRSDLQSSRSSEQELRLQVRCYLFVQLVLIGI